MNKEDALRQWPSVCITAQTITTDFMQLMHVHKWTSMGTGDDTCRLSCECRRGLPRVPVSQSMSLGHPKCSKVYGSHVQGCHGQYP